MKRRELKAVAVLMVCILASFALFTGCGGAKSAGENPSTAAAIVANATTVSTQTDNPNELEWKKDTTPFTFKEYFNGSWATMYPWNPDGYADKLVTQKTGITIDRFIPTGNDSDYLNTLIASGDLPDTLFIEWSNPIVQRLIKSGQFYSMNELIDQYCPKFWGILDKEMVQYHSVDGKLYYLPNFYTTKDSSKDIVYNAGNSRPFFVRKDIYEAIGKPKLESPDDWMAAMKLAKQKYPDISPIGVENFDVNKMGFGGSYSINYLVGSFAPDLALPQLGYFEGDAFKYSVRNPGYKEAIKFVNQMYREGLFDPQLIMNKQEQYEEKLYGGKFFMASQYPNDLYGKFNPKISSTIGADKTYEFQSVFKVGGKDPQYANSRGMGWMAWLINKKAKNPERIIKYGEYAWSEEGQLDFRYGTLGETYDIVDGIPTFKPEILDLKSKDSAAFDKKYGFEESTLMWRTGGVWDKAGRVDLAKNKPDQLATLDELNKYTYDAFDKGIDNLEPDTTSPEGVIHAKVKDSWNKILAKMILSKTDAAFEQAYNDGIALIDKMGADKAEKAVYQLHLKDLQKKGIAK